MHIYIPIDCIASALTDGEIYSYTHRAITCVRKYDPQSLPQRSRLFIPAVVSSTEAPCTLVHSEFPSSLDIKTRSDILSVIILM